MATPNYWLDLFTGTTWEEFLRAGGNVSGFREARWSTVQRIKPGDYLLCYLTGLSRFVGVLEVVAPPYKDTTPIWAFDLFPCRLKVKIVESLTPETAIPILELRDRLTIFKDLKNPNMWQGAVRGSPARWKPEDGKAVAGAIQEAKQHPVTRPVDPAKYRRRPGALASKKLGPVTVPEEDKEAVPDIEIEEGKEETTRAPTQEPVSKEATAHTEIQWLLLKLGNDMGLSVWAPRGDRTKEQQGRRLDSLPNILSELPLQFDEATNRIIENIDVLWLKGNSYQAAFEIESTTSIYSGLLRMSDLISMQPNLNIPLFLVAPDERRSKVVAQVNRATFSRLDPPLIEICRYIPFSELRERVRQVEPFLRYLRPDFLQEVSESCEPDG